MAVGPHVARTLVVVLVAGGVIAGLPIEGGLGTAILGMAGVALGTTFLVYLWVIRPLVRETSRTERRATARVRTVEGQLRHAQRLESVGRLTSGVAHDFNNALTVILGNADSLGHGGTEGQEGRERLDEIISSAMHAAELAKQLLNHGRRAESRTEPVDLSHVVRSLLPSFRALMSEEIEIEVDVPADLPRVLADRLSIEQILLNLTTNARDAMPQGGCLRLELAEAMCMKAPGGARRSVRMAVSDTGVGMDPQTKARVFEPFFTTKPLEKGTGLGLPMIAQLVEEHGGGVHITSERGKGTRVEIDLPQAPVAKDQVGNQASRREGRAVLSSSPGIFGRRASAWPNDPRPPAA